MRKWMIAGGVAVLSGVVVAGILLGPTLHNFIRARTR
jgi:hypothetical protein